MSESETAPAPLIVTDDERLAAMIGASLAETGWEVIAGFELAPREPGRSVHVGVVRSEVDAQLALRLASRGAGLVLTADATADPLLVAQLLDDLSRLGPVEERRLTDDPLAQLESDERELLRLLASGASLAEAARRLYLSPRSLDRRLSRVRGKLGVGTTTEALALAARSRAGRASTCG